MNYFDVKQYIAKVDKNNSILGKVEKWQAHKEGILHRAFTIALFYQDHVLLQHRKHPVFDTVFDITISSHQIFTGETLQTDEEAILNTLKREWHVTEHDLVIKPEMKGTVYYQAADPKSEYREHEVCHIYSCSIDEMKMPNLDFAYGFSLQKIDDIKNQNHELYPLLAPWVKEAFKEGIL